MQLSFRLAMSDKDDTTSCALTTSWLMVLVFKKHIKLTRVTSLPAKTMDTSTPDDDKSKVMEEGIVRYETSALT